MKTKKYISILLAAFLCLHLLGINELVVRNVAHFVICKAEKNAKDNMDLNEDIDESEKKTEEKNEDKKDEATSKDKIAINLSKYFKQIKLFALISTVFQNYNCIFLDKHIKEVQTPPPDYSIC